MLVLGIERPSSRDLPLNVNLLRPIGVLRIAQLVPQLGKSGDVRPGGFGIARAGCSERARKMGDRLHLSQRTGTDLKLCRSLPVAAFHRVARGRNSQRVRPGQVCLCEAGDHHHLVDDGLRFHVLSELQIGINEVVHRMQLVVKILGLLCDTRRFDIRRDRFSPIADARKNV